MEHWAFNGCGKGFTDHLQQIVSLLGGLDVPTIKVGAYGPSLSWYDIYMTRENAVAAHAMLNGKRLLPVHWAAFNMARHIGTSLLCERLRPLRLRTYQLLPFARAKW